MWRLVRRRSGDIGPENRRGPHPDIQMATRGARGIAGTLLVTADPAAAALAAEFGARTLVQRLPGLNAALREARAAAMREGATAILILPIDLPAISPTTIERLLDEASPPAGKLQIVVAVPDRHGSGTNALLVSPPTAIDPAFGEGSLEAHRTAAERAGAAFIQHDGALTLDVDTGADLLVAQATNSNGGTDAA